ncbi:PDZ domain-containing protein [Neisseriaceae bacterium PsAf]|nr:PDZ domain-containing protein [Neisseriaceae bacterium PsAf]
MKKTSIYAIGAIIGMGLTLSLQTYAGPSSAQESLPVREIKTFAEVYGQIKANYYENTKDSELMENAMKGMVSGLDPHSEYLNQEDFKGLMEQTTGKFDGLGIEIVKDESFIKIVTPIEDTPAFRAGLKPNDYIIKIDGVSTKGMSTMEASKKMRGKPGSYVTLTITRKDELTPFDVKLKRDTINIKTVKSQLVEPGIGYIRVNSFKEQTLEDFVEHINQLSKANGKPLDGLVFDLRNNGGGLLNSAVGLTAVFVPENSVVVSTKGRDNVRQNILKASKNDYKNPMDGAMFKDPLVNLPAEIKKVPITLLINGGSASASEIVTGALQDYQRAVVVGTQSFGKGSVQTIIPLSNNDGIKLTVALYYTPKDRSIQARGIVPDVIIKTEDDDLFGFREADFNNHLSNPKGEEEVKGSISKPLGSENLDKKAKEEKTQKIREKILKESSYNYMPDPKQDIQLKKAIEITKNNAEWKRSLGKYKANEKKIIQEEKKDKKN